MRDTISGYPNPDKPGAFILIEDPHHGPVVKITSKLHPDDNVLGEGGYDLPGKPHVDYTIPGPEEIDGALLTLILLRGGVEQTAAMHGSRTRKHANLVALAMLGDLDAGAYLRSKGFLTPATLVPCECAEFQTGEVIQPDELTIRFELDMEPFRQAVGRAQDKLRALAVAAYLKAAGRCGPPKPKAWTGNLTPIIGWEKLEPEAR